MVIGAVSANGQGCVCARLIPPPFDMARAGLVGVEENSYLAPHQFSASLSFRWLHSFREFHGSQELPYPTDKFLYANTHVYGYDLSAIYQATPRVSVSLEIPFSYGSRLSYYEHDFVHKHAMHASGIGDMRLIGNVWLFKPDTNPEGNISIGLGVKFPTGDYDAKDISYRATGAVVRPVDPAIQPGDGGWGVVTQLNAFRQLFPRIFAYAQGIYLINPRDINGVQQPTGDEPDFTLGKFGYTFNSVPDQYLARSGLDYVIWPKAGLSLSLGWRVEGVPVEDFLGGSRGWRNAGYAFSIEPGLSVAKGRFSFSVTGPVALVRHADKNLTDIQVSRQLHADFGGNAAFADYLVTASASYRF